jgi:hypothetical protein
LLLFALLASAGQRGIVPFAGTDGGDWLTATVSGGNSIPSFSSCSTYEREKMPPVETSVLLDAMKLTNDLALKFFITFSRFEYALLAAGYHTDPTTGPLLTDWDCFKCFLTKKVDPKELQPVIDAGNYLIKNPPGKLILGPNGPDFEPVILHKQREIEFLIEGVKRSRNNFFHGNKFYIQQLKPDRNKLVLETSLTVLEKLLEVPSLSAVNDRYRV